MAAAFALGAEGVQMGTRMVSSAESPVHDNWKNAILAAQETDTVFLNRYSSPACARCAPSARPGSSARSTSAWTSSAAPSTSTSAATWKRRSRCPVRWSGASTRSEPVAQIVDETLRGFFEVVGDLAERYVPAAAVR